MIGNKQANAINPNPSMAGFLPGTFVAIPRPTAVTTGTVTVEVVTPPKS